MRPTNVAVLVVLSLSAGVDAPSGHLRATAPPPVAFNDNRHAAGRLKNGVLELSLEANEGTWRPRGPKGPAIPILTFGETGKPLQTPGPLVRVKQGTKIHLRMHNALPRRLIMHGFSKHVSETNSLIVPPNETGEVTYQADDPGTYYYWGTSGNEDIDERAGDGNGLLNGALIVDPADRPPAPDRVFVLQWYIPIINGDANREKSTFSINGAPWPATERLSYAEGDSIRWHIINASPDPHPMHLHGFFFRVSSHGNDYLDTLYSAAQQRMGVTELFNNNQTATLSWKADRPGNWIFHCHNNGHIMVDSVLMTGPPDHSQHENHAESSMGGLVMGINIKPSTARKPYRRERRRLRLTIESDSLPGDTTRTFHYELSGDSTITHPQPRPGPPIILYKGQPTSIWVVNHSTEPSQVHWHGLEIDSYYDGVAGLSSNAGKLAPMIMPSDSFEVTVTPPRAGSFMYHTHLDDIRQQSHGLYGPLIVVDSAKSWDPSRDFSFMASIDPTNAPLLNGTTTPPALSAETGTSYRIRLMNLTLTDAYASFSLVRQGPPPRWTPRAKDGYDLPPDRRTSTIARQQVTIGETRDFEMTFPAPGDYSMRLAIGRTVISQVIHVVAR